MQATPPPVPVARKSRRRWRLIGGFALLLIATPFAYQFVAGWLRDRELEEIYREMDAEDPHWRWPDLIAQIPAPPPDDRNAAVQLLKVGDLLKKTPFNARAKKTKSRDNRVRMSADQVQVLRSAFSRLDANVLNEARKLKDMPEGCIAIKPVENPYEIADPRPNERLAVMRLLQHDALLRGHDGDLSGAAESCQALLNAAHASSDFPTLMTQLIRTRAQVLAVDALERTLEQGEVNDKHLKQLQASLAREAESQGLYKSMRGERAFVHQTYMMFRDGKITDAKWLEAVDYDNRIPKPFRYLFPKTFVREYPERLRLHNELVQATQLPDEAQTEAFRKLEKKVQANSSLKEIGYILVPVLQMKETQARLRCAIAAVAAERYRLKHNNTWPGGLDDLVKDGLLKKVIKDPYDGKPLRFKRTPTGVIVYSVGPDMIDNGGKIAAANPLAAGTDIGFELWDRRGVPPPASEETP
jgi:hypothetical protein